jgi:hypothetical protein
MKLQVPCAVLGVGPESLGGKRNSPLRKDGNKAFHYAFWTKSENDWDNHREVRRLFTKFLHRAK